MRRTVLILGVVVVVGVASAGLFLTAPSPKPPSAGKATKPKVTIVTATQQQFSTFAKRNHLAASDYHYNAELGNYVVHQDPNRLNAAGVKTQPSYIYRALTAPTDSLSGIQYALPLTSTTNAWGTSTGSSSTIIAVVDTGFALNHDGLQGKWWTNPGEIGTTASEGPTPNCVSRGLTPDKSCNDLDNDGDGLINDWRGWDFANNDNDVSAGTTGPTSQYVSHGTMTSSVAAAGSTAGTSIAGVCPSCTIMPIQVLNDDGIGDTDTVASGIRYAADHGANVISLSLGSDSPDPTLEDAVNYALGKNIVVVAAAGNSGPGNMAYPAQYPGVIAVGATDSSDNLASWSSTGPQLSVVAPGVNVLADTWSSGNQISNYGYASGTSLSTPFVAGIAGLLHSVSPTDPPATIANFLTHGATKVAGMGGNAFTNQYGYGRVNTDIAVLASALPHPDGSLVQATNDTAIYLIEDGKRRHIDSPAVFYSQGFSPSQIHLANAADMALPTGSDLDFRPGTLLKDGSSPSVYIAEDVSGTIEKAHIASSSVFLGLGYQSVATNALVIPTSQLPATTAADVASTTAHVSGTMVRSASDQKVYLIDNGQLSYVQSPVMLETYGYTNQQILPATTADLALPHGSNLLMRNGALLKASAPQVYIVVNNQSGYSKRPISSSEVFLGLGYQSVASDVFTVNSSELPATTTTGY